MLPTLFRSPAGDTRIAILGLRVSLALAVLASAMRPGAAAAQEATGAVYTLTNAAAGNAVVGYQRAADGRLTPGGVVSTGGTGSGSGLQNQGAVILSSDHHWLFAVNAGSNEISAFSVGAQGLALVDKVASGGVRPVSVTAHGNWLYVLNAGGTNSITGFTIGDRGTLATLSDSTRLLSAASTGPAQIQFSPDGALLVVTERDTNVIDTYTVGKDGRPSNPIPHPSSGANPFGFAFGQAGQLFVSEAFEGHPNGSATSSYLASADGSLQLVTTSAATHQSTACWLVIANNGSDAYVSNTQSGSLSGYRIGADGSLSLLSADGVTAAVGAGTAPTDMAVSSDGRYLYVLGAGSHTVVGYRVEPDGSLTPIGVASGPPPGANGLAAW